MSHRAAIALGNAAVARFRPCRRVTFLCKRPKKSRLHQKGDASPTGANVMSRSFSDSPHCSTGSAASMGAARSVPPVASCVVAKLGGDAETPPLSRGTTCRRAHDPAWRRTRRGRLRRACMASLGWPTTTSRAEGRFFVFRPAEATANGESVQAPRTRRALRLHRVRATTPTSLAIILSANWLHFTSVAPSIRRAKS